MNFDYMKNAPDFAQLYTYCCEAGGVCARKAQYQRHLCAQGDGVCGEAPLWRGD